MNNKDYLDASEKFASNELHADLVSEEVLWWRLWRATDEGRQVDAIKKALFYGKYSDDAFFSPGHSLPTGCRPYAVNPKLLHAVLGLFTEASELMECIMKAMEEDEPLDEVNMLEEAGDLEWYLAMLYRELGKTPEESKQININKLSARYPGKFDAERANNRDLTKEREILDGRT